MILLEVLEETLEALQAGGFSPGGDVYDNFKQAVMQLKAGGKVKDKLLRDAN